MMPVRATEVEPPTAFATAGFELSGSYVVVWTASVTGSSLDSKWVSVCCVLESKVVRGVW